MTGNEEEWSTKKGNDKKEETLKLHYQKRDAVMEGNDKGSVCGKISWEMTKVMEMTKETMEGRFEKSTERIFGKTKKYKIYISSMLMLLKLFVEIEAKILVFVPKMMNV